MHRTPLLVHLDPEHRLPSSNRAAPLPGEHSVDENLLDEVVPQINALYVQRGLQLAEAMGELLLARFFDGDLDVFRTRGRKHQSLRALAQRSDLHVSHAQLWNCLAVLEQLRELPPELGQALSMHHHKALLPVRDEATKHALAEKAVSEGLSYRQLQAEVQAARTGEDARRGRPRLPAWVKGLQRVLKALAETNEAEVGARDFDYFETRQARRLVGDIDAQITALQRLKNEVLAKAADLEGPLD
jgi:hypothetical protein